MPVNLTTSEANRLLDQSVPESGLFVTLTSTTPNDASNGVELTGGGYSRQALSTQASADHLKSNTSQLTFTIGVDTDVNGIEVWTASSGGTRRWYGVITRAGMKAGDMLVIPIGGLVLRSILGGTFVDAEFIAITADSAFTGSGTTLIDSTALSMRGDAVIAGLGGLDILSASVALSGIGDFAGAGSNIFDGSGTQSGATTFAGAGTVDASAPATLVDVHSDLAGSGTTLLDGTGAFLGQATFAGAGDIVGNVNLLSTNASGIETSAAGWVAGNAGTAAPARSTAVHYVGAASLSVVRNDTSTKPLARLATAERVTVEPGGQYTGSCKATSNSTDGGRVGALSIEWYNSSGTLISTSVGADVNLVNGTWDDLTVTGTAPATAAKAGLIFGEGAADASTTFTFFGDEFAFAAVPGIAFVGTSTAENGPTGVTTHTVSKPAAAKANDVAIVSVATAGGSVLGSPAGYTAISSLPVGGLTGPRLHVFRRILDGTTADNFSATTGSAIISSLAMNVYRGVDLTQVLDVAVSEASDNTSGSSTITIPGVTPVTDGSMMYSAVASNSVGTAVSISPPGSMNNRSSSSLGQKSATADQVVAAAATGSRVWTLSAARSWAGFIAVLRAAISSSTPAPPQWQNMINTDFTSLSALPAPWVAYNFANSNNDWGWYLGTSAQTSRPHVVVAGGVASLFNKYEAYTAGAPGPAAGSSHSGYDANGSGFYQGTFRASDGSLGGSTDYRVTFRMRILQTGGQGAHHNLPLWWPQGGVGSMVGGEDDTMESNGLLSTAVGYNQVFIHYPDGAGHLLFVSRSWPSVDMSQWHVYREQKLGKQYTVWIDDMNTPVMDTTIPEFKDYAKIPVFQQETRLNMNVGTTGQEEIQISYIQVDIPA